MTIENNIIINNSVDMLTLIQSLKKDYANSGDAGYLKLAISFVVMESLQEQIIDLNKKVKDLENQLAPKVFKQ